jgi:hypothetical protein
LFCLSRSSDFGCGRNYRREGTMTELSREGDDTRRDALARDLAEEQTGMPAYLVNDEAWAAAVTEADEILAAKPETKPMTGLPLAIRLAKGGPLSTDSADQIDAYFAALKERRRA